MILAAVPGDFLYDLLLTLHILAIVVGFGATFVPDLLAARAGDDPAKKKVLGEVGEAVEWTLIQPGIIAAGVTGLLLVLTGDPWEFSDAWISIAFLLFFLGEGLALFGLSPTAKKLRASVAKLESSQGGDATARRDLEAAEKRVAMFGGMLHLIFLLLVLDMVFKPGA